MHNKLPSDDNLVSRGCQLPSMCSICNTNAETLDHLFIHCSFAQSIWHWLISLMNITCSITSVSDALDLCKRNWSPKCKLVILVAVVNCLNTIWFCRNQIRFNDKKILLRLAINLIITNIALCGNSSKLAANSSISEFVILKAFSVQISLGNAPKIKEVIWQPPIFNWVKCNIDGASIGNPGP